MFSICLSLFFFFFFFFWGGGGGGGLIWIKLQKLYWVAKESAHFIQICMTHKVHNLMQNSLCVIAFNCEDAPLVEVMYTLYLLTCQVSYSRWLRSWFLHSCNIFWVLINSLVGWFCVQLQFTMCRSKYCEEIRSQLHTGSNQSIPLSTG